MYRGPMSLHLYTTMGSGSILYFDSDQNWAKATSCFRVANICPRTHKHVHRNTTDDDAEHDHDS